MYAPRKHERLKVWHIGVELVTTIYEVTQGFPDVEKFGLVSQMRRCSVSIPSNIAEGSARGSDKEFIRYLHIAKASIAELETQIHIAGRLGFIQTPDALLLKTNELFAKINQLIAAVIKHQTRHV